MSNVISTQIQLVSRPVGWPTQDDFRTVHVTYGDLAPGQVRVTNAFISVDPYMRGRMNDAKSYAPPYALGATMTGGAIGRVVESNAPAIAVGSLVLHQYGWRDVVQEDAAGFQVIDEVPGVPLSLRLGILGMTGLTGYVGLTAIAEVSLDRQGAGHLDAFEQRAVQDAAVRQCWRVAPGPDFVLVLRVADMPHYQAVAERLFTQDANVRNVRAFFSVKRAKFQPQVPLAAGRPDS